MVSYLVASATSYADLIEHFGFPIVCVIFMALYIKELQKEHKEEIKMITEEHKAETKELTDVVDGVKLVLQKLVDLLERKE